MIKINAIGLMSGSSLDGLDIAYCKFVLQNNNWTYEIDSANTFSFPDELKKALKKSANMNAFDLMKLNKQFGVFSAKSVNHFIDDNDIGLLEVDLVASHGHTIFHQPELKFSTQIGCGATINALTKLKTICDFRSTDVALSGQGAPLVPIGDELLFNQYQACLNLGGIANISFKENGIRKAYDVSFANLPLNYICREYFDSEYDKDGELAKTGKLKHDLLSQLKALSFYTKQIPKSLSREDFETEILPLLSGIKPEDALATFYTHFTDVIAKELNAFDSVLITGGGAYNTHFIELIKQKTSCEITLPNASLTEFKEALIFAFLGCLNHLNKTNVLKAVTGSRFDTVSGATYDAFPNSQ